MPKRRRRPILTGAKITYGYWPSKMTDRERNGGGNKMTKSNEMIHVSFHPGVGRFSGIEYCDVCGYSKQFLAATKMPCKKTKKETGRERKDLTVAWVQEEAK